MLEIYVKSRKNEQKRDYERKSYNMEKWWIKIKDNLNFLSKIMYTKFEKRQNI